MTDAAPYTLPATPPNTPEARRASAILTIDSGAIRANWRLLHDRAQAGPAEHNDDHGTELDRADEAAVETAAVIKAAGYGVGAEVAGPALLAEGCRVFFVATIDEGIALRQLLGQTAEPGPEIHILSGFMDGCERELAAHGLSPILNALADVEAWGVFCRAAGERHPATLHVDTGMSRLGLAPTDVERLAAGTNLLAGLNLTTIMSHLVAAEEPANPMNNEQQVRFRRALARLPAARASLANSSGIFLGADYTFDMVRPGAALFGINPTPGKPNPMRQVVRLQAKILQVREIDSPETVGYGATYQAGGPVRVATIAAGYADGLNRSLGNRGVAYIGEHPAPYVGRVSMDLITLDVSAVPHQLARPGALADIIGPLNPVDDVALRGETIGYELMTNLGRRYHRVVI